MTGITIRVLDGADRGRVFQNLTPPITIGREEGNTIQLNDERVSRYHVKIQEDHNRLVITDLESTNGTKVNGEDVQLRILRFGDMIAARPQRAAVRLARADRPAAGHACGPTTATAAARPIPTELDKAANISSLDFELNWSEDADLQATIHALEPPELPERLTPGQAAQLAELLEFLHLRLRNLIGSVQVDSKSNRRRARPAAVAGADRPAGPRWRNICGRLASRSATVGRGSGHSRDFGRPAGLYYPAQGNRELCTAVNAALSSCCWPPRHCSGRFRHGGAPRADQGRLQRGRVPRRGRRAAAGFKLSLFGGDPAADYRASSASSKAGASTWPGPSGACAAQADLAARPRRRPAL